jgi:hypothetical protein
MARRKRRRVGPLGEVTKRDFVAIAEILCEKKASASLKTTLADYFRSQNPRFDRERFLRATTSCRV